MGDDVPVAGQTAASRTQRERWEAYFALVYAVTVAIVEAERLAPPARILASAALALMVPWYLYAVRPLMRLGEARRPPAGATLRGPAALTILVGLFAVVQSQDTNAWTLAFALTPICLQVTTVRRGMAFVVLLNCTAALLVALRNPHPGLAGALAVLAIVVFSIGSAHLFSRWLLWVIAQSEERAALIEQLESARVQLAAAHHEAGVLAERHRLAGEIHDTLAQGFTSIVTLVQAAAAGLAPDSPAQAHLELALDTARENVAEARTLVAALDVILMDLRMPGGDGVAATGRIREVTAAKVVVLTTYDTDADILRAVEAGAAGYLLKDTTQTELAGAVRAAARGETVLAPAVAGRLVARLREPPAEPLTARETEVLALAARGATNAEIGRGLFISEATVKTHLLRVFGKLGVSGRTAAVTAAIERGLLPRRPAE